MTARRRMGRLRLRVAVPLVMAVCVVAVVLSSIPAAAWTSNLHVIPNDTHTRLTRQAVNDVINRMERQGFTRQADELKKYREDVIKGANNEDTHKYIQEVYMDDQFDRQANLGSNWGSETPAVWLDAFKYYYGKGELQTAYRMLGSLLHLVEDQAVPSHALNVIHGELFNNLWDNLEQYCYLHYGTSKVDADGDFARGWNPAQYYYEVRLMMRRTIVDGYAFYPFNDIKEDAYIETYENAFGKLTSYCIWGCYWRQPLGVEKNHDGEYAGGCIPTGTNAKSTNPKDIFAHGKATKGGDKAGQIEENRFAKNCLSTAAWGATQCMYDALTSGGYYPAVDTGYYSGMNASYPFLYP